MIGVSIIIPSFNGGNRLSGLLKSLLLQTFSDFELIVVIDGSTDNSLQVLEQFSKRFKSFNVIVQENKGRAGARNTGVKAAKGKLLVFLDDDMRVEKNVIEAHFFRHKRGVGIIVGSQVEDHALLQTDIQSYKRHLSIKWQRKIATEFSIMAQPYITAANFSILRSSFDALGGFDERLTDCEDHDLAIRAQGAGIQIYFDPEIIGWHDDFISAKKYVNRLREYEKAYNRLCHLKGLKSSVLSCSFPKKAVYWILSFHIWIKWIDAQVLLWLPERIRYRLYDAIFFSQSRLFAR